MQFEWDDAKAQSNLAKHGMRFDVAIRVFDDPHQWRGDVSRPQDAESRLKTVGVIEGRLITVVYTLRSGAIRIISARRANVKESRSYGDRSLHT
jgi:uncharacterized protein